MKFVLSQKQSRKSRGDVPFFKKSIKSLENGRPRPLGLWHRTSLLDLIWDRSKYVSRSQCSLNRKTLKPNTHNYQGLNVSRTCNRALSQLNSYHSISIQRTGKRPATKTMTSNCEVDLCTGELCLFGPRLTCTRAQVGSVWEVCMSGECLCLGSVCVCV